MISQSKGKIYLTEERGHSELDWFRSYNTFNFGKYYNEHKMPFGALYVLNEDTLAGGRGVTMAVEEDSDIILIPTTGDIQCNNNNGVTSVIKAGQVLHFSSGANTTFTVTNPFETELVSFLQIWLRTQYAAITTIPRIFSFDIERGRNNLSTILQQPSHPVPGDSSPYTISLGKFDGREEATHTLASLHNGLFVFVIEGTFEVQHRLLHTGDGLALWDINAVELEALSNDAVILVLEVPLS